ncbi:MAG: DUF1365 domain-containing protein [Acidobacteriota bacterium]
MRERSNDSASELPMRAGTIYAGRVRHHRRTPRTHRFSYRLFMLLLDLERLESLLAATPGASATGPALLRYRREDYFGDPSLGLAETVRAEVEAQSGLRPDGPIYMLTHLRTLGFAFNPVSFFYCYSADGERLEHIVAEITNTPWDERYCYVLSEPSTIRGGVRRYDLAKDFHVSPFMPMEQRYVWRFNAPGEHLLVHMETQQDDRKIFDATLMLQDAGAVTGRSLLGAQLRHPAMTLHVVAAIYWQAARLWLKRTPFHEHPATRGRAGTVLEDAR